MKNYFIGFDIGTDCITAVVMSSDYEVEKAIEPVFHFGNPALALSDLYNEILNKWDPKSILSVSLTGSGGEYFAEKLGIPFFHDTIAIPAGVIKIIPDADYVFHIGAKDAYFFNLESIQTDTGTRSFVSDHSTCTKCGGGSGILMTRQCRRFFENDYALDLSGDASTDRHRMGECLARIFQRAEEEISTSKKEMDVGGRCGVVIQSDMIHLQNSGEGISDILAGLYNRIISNFKSDVLKTRQPETNKTAVVNGGVFTSNHMLRKLEELLGLTITRHDSFRHTGAIGAVIKAQGTRSFLSPDMLNNLTHQEKSSVKTTGPLHHYLKAVSIHKETPVERTEKNLKLFCNDISAETTVVLGIDGGSTTTKAVIASSSDLKLIGEICLNTNGKPLETIQEIFNQIRTVFHDQLTIEAVAYTGSSGAFYHRMFTGSRNGNGSIALHLDIVKDEITCHALGVKHFNNKVDTIFELGGQDAKFTVFDKKESVKKSKMNLSCMAGTGQTMQNMVEMIGLDINDSFHEAALSADQTPIVDDTCGVFTEAGIAKLIALGFPKNEIAAAIAYGFMGGYVNKFIGNETFGDFASAQGGPFNGKACLAALAMHTKMKINALPHRQMFGAIGAAIAAQNDLVHIRKKGLPIECLFRGFDLAEIKFQKNEANCSIAITDSCAIKDCKLNIYDTGKEKILSGGACPKGNSGEKPKKAPDYISFYKRILNKHLAPFISELSSRNEKERVLIPRSLTFLNQKGIYYTALYHALGFDIALSPESDDAISASGIHYAHSETCFPVKLAHGHVACLKEHMQKGNDKLLLINAIGTEKHKYKFCPYISGAGFLTKDALDIENKDALLPVIHFNDSDHPISKAIFDDLFRVYGKRFSIDQVKTAIEAAQNAESQFINELQIHGQKIIKRLKRKKEIVYYGIGRGYTLFDDKAGSSVQNLFASQGLHFLPAVFLKPSSHRINDVTENMYWVQGREIIKTALDAALSKGLFPVRLTNFNCGSDSILLFHEEKIMGTAGKPHLVLQTDGHNNNAQFGTRITANNEVVKSFIFKKTTFDDYTVSESETVFKNKIIGIPYIGDNSYIIAASFNALGYNAEVIPTNTDQAKDLAKKINGTNICMPFSYQVGDCLAWLHNFSQYHGDPNKKAVIIEPTAKGPCRFGQYNVLLKRIFAENGFAGAQVCSPDADRDYINIPLSDREIMFHAMMFFKGIFCLDVLHDSLLRTRPYEKEEGASKKIYDSYLIKLNHRIENRARTKELLALITTAQSEFEANLKSDAERKPIVSITGEIFVRLHPDANSNSIELLEKHGLEVRLSPLTQWMEYSNSESIKKFKTAGAWKKYLIATTKRYYMKSRRKRLSRPFENYLNERKPHDLHHILDQIEKELVYDKKIEGESPISIGEALLFSQEKMTDISGIYHVGPFGCMQETAATSQINAITRKQRDKTLSATGKIIPYMDAVFGDSELSNIEAEIAAFSEKCYLKKELQKQALNAKPSQI